MEQEGLSVEDLTPLDWVARATLAGDAALGQVRSLHESDACLRVPNSVTSYSPTSLPDPLEVAPKI